MSEELVTKLANQWRVTSHQQYGCKEKDLPRYVIEDFNYRLKKVAEFAFQLGQNTRHGESK
jgi:hypothetical protein